MLRLEFARRFIELDLPLTEREFDGLMKLISEIAVDEYITEELEHLPTTRKGEA